MDHLLSEFLELTAYSVPSKHEHDIRECLKQKLIALGFEVSEDEAFPEHNSGNLYGFLPGEGEPILFACHMDTVDPCENKKVIVEENGTIHTDGTTILGADDVSGIVEFLAAVRRVIRLGVKHRPIEVIFTASEEFFVEGAKRLDYDRIRSKQCYVLDTDGEIGTAVIAAPTGIRIIANITGKASHAALRPEDGINAIAVAAEAIDRMKLGRIDGETTANIGIIHGGKSGNIVPGECFVEGETRSLNHESALRQMEHMCDCFMNASDHHGAECSMDTTLVYQAWSIPEEHPLCRNFACACGKNVITPRFMKACGGSDASRLSEHGIDCLILATGMHEIHSTSEYISLQEMQIMTRVITELMIL